ncbi:hypothetical protein GJ629_02090 [Halapricum sp. CBA1109]|uniref:hypothetical protein n=1 Tax=Halapricum sp. CBA1109 TaxID=2668068 RepID=UPI0012FB1311|nr:hypothetical protein [Halapricum sp. CBA1109]MUV88829.1 hypothetical protein [Halapricum sp. CBA1109]
MLDEDWDNLIVLDACRYDTFLNNHSFEGKLSSRISKGSNTYEFLKANFSGRELYDTVYVSSNLWFPNIKDEIDAEVHSFVPVTTEGPKVAVRPEAVTERALEVNQSHQDKRLIIHYTQPHYPYFGPTGQEYFDHHDTSSLQLAMRRNGDDIPKDVVQRAYEENLDMVLEEVERLLPELRGKTVVTADHGEMLGERSFPIPITDYGHPNTIYTEELVKVPWLEIDEGSRKEITAERPDNDIDISDDEIDANLRALGYKT